MSNVADTIEYKGCKIEIRYDESPESPRTWDNLSKMVMFHPRYDLPNDEHVKAHDFDGWDGLEDHLREVSGAKVILKVRMYDHGGVSLSTNIHDYPYNDRWDSSMVGFVYATAESIEEAFGFKGELTSEQRKKIEDALDADVRLYSDYLNGNVYGYVAYDETGEEIDACWGFYGWDHGYGGAVEGGEVAIDNYLRWKEEEEKKLQNWMPT